MKIKNQNKWTCFLGTATHSETYTSMQTYSNNLFYYAIPAKAYCCFLVLHLLRSLEYLPSYSPLPLAIWEQINKAGIKVKQTAPTTGHPSELTCYYQMCQASLAQRPQIKSSGWQKVGTPYAFLCSAPIRSNHFLGPR